MTQDQFDEAMNSEPDDYLEECKRICGVAKDRLDIDMSRDQAKQIWEEYSDSVACGWLHIDSDEAIVSAIEQYVGRRV